MTMRQIFTVIACIVFVATASSSATAAEGVKITLDEALDRALTANRDIQVAKERLAEIEGLKGEALSEGLPQLTGNASYQRLWRKPKMFINNQIFTIGSNNSYNASAEVSQLLWDGGKVIGAVKAAKTEKARGIEDIRDMEAQIRLNVKQTFYQILYTNKVIEVLERQLNQLKEHLASIQTRFNKGMDSDYTLMRQQVEVNNVEPQIIDAEKMRELLTNSLKILMAVNPEEKIEPAGILAYNPRSLPDAPAMIEKARATRPDLNAQRFHEKTLTHVVTVEKAGYWPSLKFNSTYQWQGQSDNWGVGPNERADSLASSFNLSWPIFDGLKTKSRVDQARAKLMQQRYSTSQLEDSVVREVEDAITSLEKAQAAYRSQLGSFNLAKKATNIASERFESGLMSQLELNDTINAQAQAEQLYLQAVYDCLSAEAVLEKAIGGAL